VFAGSFANYLFASVLFFAALMLGGRPLPPSTTVNVVDGKAAAAGQMKNGDRVVAIDGKAVTEFIDLQRAIEKSGGKPLAFEVERDGKRLPLSVTPKEDPEAKRFLIGVEAVEKWVPVTVKEAARSSVILPAIVVRDLVVGMANIASVRMKDLSGPIGIVKIGAKRSDRGFHQLLEFMGILSAYLGGFNLLPIPALDGGRLIFLIYEAVARRKPNAKIEAHIHAVGLLMFLALMVVVSIFDIRN
jgi:regulator of sigma E protease